MDQQEGVYHFTERISWLNGFFIPESMPFFFFFFLQHCAAFCLQPFPFGNPATDFKLSACTLEYL